MQSHWCIPAPMEPTVIQTMCARNQYPLTLYEEGSTLYQPLNKYAAFFCPFLSLSRSPEKFPPSPLGFLPSHSSFPTMSNMTVCSCCPPNLQSQMLTLHSPPRQKITLTVPSLITKCRLLLEDAGMIAIFTAFTGTYHNPPKAICTLSNSRNRICTYLKLDMP